MRLLFALILAVAAVPALAEPPELLDGGYEIDQVSCQSTREGLWFEGEGQGDGFARVDGNRIYTDEITVCRIAYEYRHADDLYLLLTCKYDEREFDANDPKNQGHGPTPVHLWRITQEPGGKLFISINHAPRTRLYRESECKPPKARG